MTIRDFGPPAPLVKVKAEPGTATSSRGKKRATMPPPTDEEVEAQFQRVLAIAQKLSFDTIQPATREFAEHWSCVEDNIIDLNSEVQPTSPPVKEEVKEEEPVEAPPQQEAGVWNVDDAVAAHDWDAFYGYWTDN